MAEMLMFETVKTCKTAKMPWLKVSGLAVDKKLSFSCVNS